MIELGYGTEVSIIRDILSWPLEWSSLHGIEEIRSPVVKMSLLSHYFNEEHVIKITGTSFPKNGGKGAKFPYNKGDYTSISNFTVFKISSKMHKIEILNI